MRAYSWGDLELKTALHLFQTMFSLFDEKNIWNASIARVYKDAYQIEKWKMNRELRSSWKEHTMHNVWLRRWQSSTVNIRQTAEKLSTRGWMGLSLRIGFGCWMGYWRARSMRVLIILRLIQAWGFHGPLRWFVAYFELQCYVVSAIVLDLIQFRWILVKSQFCTRFRSLHLFSLFFHHRWRVL